MPLPRVLVQLSSLFILTNTPLFLHSGYESNKVPVQVHLQHLLHPNFVLNRGRGVTALLCTRRPPPPLPYQFWSPLRMTEEARQSFSRMDQGSVGPALSSLCSAGQGRSVRGHTGHTGTRTRGTAAGSAPPRTHWPHPTPRPRWLFPRGSSATAPFSSGHSPVPPPPRPRRRLLPAVSPAPPRTHSRAPPPSSPPGPEGGRGGTARKARREAAGRYHAPPRRVRARAGGPLLGPAPLCPKSGR